MLNTCDKYRRVAVVFETAAASLYRMATENHFRTAAEIDALIYVSTILESASAEANASDSDVEVVVTSLLDMIPDYPMTPYIEVVLNSVLNNIASAISSV